ncbi:MAG: MotA/TolQ/ExbB proton channel family protein [Elusimicrobiota bacterium]|nr:MotA/TolQ/ExbB proton channel family protein [Elusimicrobiota bacterium]
MKRLRYLWLKKIKIFVSAMIFAGAPLWGNSSDELNELNELKEALRKERILRVNDKIAGYNKLKSLEMKVYSTEDKLQEMRVDEIEQEEILSNLEEEKKKIDGDLNVLKTGRKEIEECLKARIGEVEEKIKNGFPHKKNERLLKLNSVEGQSAFFSFLEEELLLWKKCDFRRGEADGKEAEIFRAGGIFAVYKSTSGVLGLLTKRVRKGKCEYRWREIQKRAEKKKIEKIFMEIKGGGNIVPLPVDVTGGTGASAKAKSGGLWSWFVSGGPVMIAIVLVALAVIIMTGERIVFFRNENIDADVLMDRVVSLWNKGLGHDAEKLCGETPGPVARMLAIALRKRQEGKKVMEEMLHQQHLEEIPRLSSHLSAIAVLAGVAPLMGLLGTVSGMISTFQVITYHGGGDPRLLAGGISEAMITTEFGLIVAIPALLLHSYLSGSADKIASDMEKNAVKLINSLPD